MSKINKELVEELLSKKKKSAKIEELQQYKDIVLELRNAGLSLQDICFYLRKEHKIKVSTSTLKSAFPELENRIGRFEKLIVKMTDEELRQAYKIFKSELQKRGLLQQHS